MLLEVICLRPDEPHYHQQQSECEQVLGVTSLRQRSYIKRHNKKAEVYVLTLHQDNF